jgi:hypothetical protein
MDGSARGIAVGKLLAVLAETVNDRRDRASRSPEYVGDFAGRLVLSPKLPDPTVEAVRVVALSATPAGGGSTQRLSGFQTMPPSWKPGVTSKARLRDSKVSMVVSRMPRSMRDSPALLSAAAPASAICVI